MIEGKKVLIDENVVGALADEENFNGLTKAMKRIMKRKRATPLPAIVLDAQTLAVTNKLYPGTTFLDLIKSQPAKPKK